MRECKKKKFEKLNSGRGAGEKTEIKYPIIEWKDIYKIK